jgi:hypothetical protein
VVVASTFWIFFAASGPGFAQQSDALTCKLEAPTVIRLVESPRITPMLFRVEPLSTQAPAGRSTATAGHAHGVLPTLSEVRAFAGLDLERLAAPEVEASASYRLALESRSSMSAVRVPDVTEYVSDLSEQFGDWTDVTEYLSDLFGDSTDLGLAAAPPLVFPGACDSPR